MAIIIKDSMNMFQSILAESYRNLLSGFGDASTPGTAAFSIAEAKNYVRGGTDAQNGVRASTVIGTTIIDLLPIETTGGTTITVKRGTFYVDGVQKELVSDVTVQCNPTANPLGGPTSWTWEGAASANFVKGLVYASTEAVSSSYEETNTSASNAGMVINGKAGGTDHYALAQIIENTATTGITFDEVQLYLSTTGSPNCNLQVQIWAADDVAFDPETDDSASLIASSGSIPTGDIPTGGGWVSFPLLSRALCENDRGGGTTIDFFVVLVPSTPDSGTYTLDTSNYISWIGNLNGGVTPANAGATNHRQYCISSANFSAGTWANLASEAGYDSTYRLVSYLHGVWTACATDAGIDVANVNYVDTPAPTSVSYVPIAALYMLENVAGSTTENFGSGSTVTDVREVVGYEGLEDDDQMGTLFPAMNTTENVFTSIVDESTSTDIIRAYSSIVTALGTHISTLATGYTFKTYWGDITRQLEFDRDFRRIWYLNNSSEELHTPYGTRTLHAADPQKWSVAVGNSVWSRNVTYCVDMDTGTDLEILTPLGGTAINASLDVTTLAIKPSWATLSMTHGTGSSVAKLAIENIPTSWSTVTASHIWVETWDGTDGELLYFSAISGSLITLASSLYVANAYPSTVHLKGARVYLVDAISYTIPTAGLTEKTMINTSGTKYVGVAYVDVSAGGTAGRQIAVRSR